MAVAMEEARIHLDEPSMRAGAPMPRDALDFGLPLALRLRMASIAAQLGRHEEALALYRANLVYEPRISPAGRGTEMFSAMLPDPAAPTLPVPAPPNASTLLVQSLTGAGQSLTALGRKQEALDVFERATAYGHRRGIPRVGTASGDTNFKGDAKAGEAALELARAAYDAGEYERALQILRHAAGTFPKDRLREANDLNRLALQKLNAQRRGPSPR
jgi:tetratricopeptide (TPR) repeat protein